MLTQELKPLEEKIVAATAAGDTASLNKSALWLDLLRQVVAYLAANILTPELVETVIREAEAFYDTTIAPIDIPYVPATAEAVLDAFLRSQIRPAIMFVYEALGGGGK